MPALPPYPHYPNRGFHVTKPDYFLNPPYHPPPTTNIEFFLLSNQTICLNKRVDLSRSVYMSFFEILLRNGPQIRPGSFFIPPQRTIYLNKTMAFFFLVGLCCPLYFWSEIGSSARPASLPPAINIEFFLLPNQTIGLNKTGCFPIGLHMFL